MKENDFIKLGLPFTEGALLMLALIYLAKLDGLILWVVFLVGIIIMTFVNVGLIYPKIFENYLNQNDTKRRTI